MRVIDKSPLQEFLLLEDKHLPSLPAPQAFSAVGTEDHLPYIDDKMDDEMKRSNRNLALVNVKANNKPPPLAPSAGQDAHVEMVDFCAKWDEVSCGESFE